jgi:hypothetical protein
MPFATKATCRLRDIDRQYQGTLRDVSILGLFMEMDDCPDVGSQCEMSIVFEGDHSRLLIENVGAEIIRREQGGVAIRFDERLEWFILIPLYFYKISGPAKNGDAPR